jgi:hypothetical protein
VTDHWTYRSMSELADHHAVGTTSMFIAAISLFWAD